MTSFISELPDLINEVLANLKSSIELNITLLCSKLKIIRGLIKCCKNTLRESLRIICCISKLICTCSHPLINCFKKCLIEIKCELREVYVTFLELYDCYDFINCLIKETQNISSCNGISELKPKICQLSEKFQCSITQFNAIESKIACIKSEIQTITQSKQNLCKEWEKIILLICISSETQSINIVIIDGNAIKNRMKCLVGEIDNLSSKFNEIKTETNHLKHLLMFTQMYFGILLNILKELECIDSQQKTLCSKILDLNNLPLQILIISSNVKYVKAVIDMVNEGRDDLTYISEGLKSIIPEMCQIKKTSETIIGLQGVVDCLKELKCSIEKLKGMDSDKKCIKIVESTNSTLLKASLTCIEDKLDINTITSKSETVQNGISSLECVIFKIRELIRKMETIENIACIV